MTAPPRSPRRASGRFVAGLALAFALLFAAAGVFYLLQQDGVGWILLLVALLPLLVSIRIFRSPRPPV